MAWPALAGFWTEIDHPFMWWFICISFSTCKIFLFVFTPSFDKEQCIKKGHVMWFLECVCALCSLNLFSQNGIAGWVTKMTKQVDLYGFVNTRSANSAQRYILCSWSAFLRSAMILLIWLTQLTWIVLFAAVGANRLLAFSHLPLTQPSLKPVFALS